MIVTVKEIGGGAGTLEVTNLNDTDISSETLNDLLVYDGSNYK